MLLLALALSLLIGATSASAAQVPSHWTWTNYGPDLRDVSCVTANTCVAVGQGGAVLRSPNTDDVPLDWTMVDLPPFSKGTKSIPVDFSGVSCSASSCIAVTNVKPDADDAGYVSWIFRSTDAGVTWRKVTSLPAVTVGKATTQSAIDVACVPDGSATARSCYAVGLDGGLWRSTDDGQRWLALDSPVTPGTVPGYSQVTCPSNDACFTVGAGATTVGAPAAVASSAVLNGNVATPLKAPPALPAFTGIACDSPARCMGTLSAGYAVLSVARGTWGNAHDFRASPKKKPKGVSARAAACPVADNCVALSATIALRTTHLDDTDQDWLPRPLATIGLRAINCVTTFCVAVGDGAAWFASFNGGQDWGRVNEVPGFDVVQCTTSIAPTCVAAGKEDVGVSRSDGTTWNLPLTNQAAFNAKSVQCDDPNTCTIFGMSAGVFTDDFSTFSPVWGPVQGPSGADAQTCVTSQLCVGASDGTVYTTFDGGKTLWSRNQFPHVRATMITCQPNQTSPVTCLASDGDVLLLGTMLQDPSGKPRWNWRYTNADPSETVSAIGCSPGFAQCTAAGKAGMIMHTVGGSLMDWTEQTVPPNVPVDELANFTSVTCPVASSCVVGGVHGIDIVIASTTNNWDDFSYDLVSDVRNVAVGTPPGISGFGCPTVNRCVGVGNSVLIGVRNPPLS
jgi:hypothetical protein